MPQDSYIKLMSKGEVFEGVVVMVNDTPSAYQEKRMFPVVLRDPKNTSKELTIMDTDFLAQEVTLGVSSMKDHIGELVKFVVMSPGDGTDRKRPWVKLDQPMQPQASTPDRDKQFLARDSFKMACDLIIAKPDKFSFEQIDEIAERIARKIINLSGKI